MIIVVKKTNVNSSQFFVSVKGDNGEVMFTSETYSAKASALHAVKMLMNEAKEATVKDETK